MRRAAGLPPLAQDEEAIRKMTLGIGLAIGIPLVVILWIITVYNGLVRRRMDVRGGWAQIDVVLKRRHDLIPNIVETVKGYAAHEKETLDRVISARNQAIGASTPGALSAAEGMLGGALRQLFALSEAYPDLKANTNFQHLSGELATTENVISAARQQYNRAVGDYNEAIAVFPNLLIAGPLGFRAEEFFELDEPEAKDAPKVKF